MLEENPDEVLEGAANLRKHIQNVRLHGVTPVVAINAMPTDFGSEHAAIREVAQQMGVRAAVGTHFADGGRGAAELAEAVAEAAEEPGEFRFLYPSGAALKEKIEAVARQADGVDYTTAASGQLAMFEKNGFGGFPVCIAKTHLSLSADPALKGAPTGWRLPVREARASAGAGFVYPICGDMRTMPGLTTHPAAEHIDIDANGKVVGLS
jgi:formate--tetrahydrofolate ligase